MAQAIDKEAILPISLIRTATKTDDVEHVTDAQLRLYRDVAFELANQFTDTTFDSDGIIEQSVGYPLEDRVLVQLKAPVADGIVTVMADGTSYILVVPVGSDQVRVGRGVVDQSGRPVCCYPCASSIQGGVSIRYKTATCGVDIPSGVKLGMLQFIAWAIAHPGDCSADQKSAKASGALATWGQYRTQIGF